MKLLNIADKKNKEKAHTWSHRATKRTASAPPQITLIVSSTLKNNALCAFRSIVSLKQLWNLQLLLRSSQACVYICQKVNILGKTPSGEELHYVKYNFGCQLSSGKALDSHLGSRNGQKPNWFWSFCCCHSHFSLTLLLIRGEFSSGDSPWEKDRESLQSAAAAVHSSLSRPPVYNLQVVLRRRCQKVLC